MAKPLRIKKHANEVGIRLSSPFTFLRHQPAPSILRGEAVTTAARLRDRVKCQCHRCSHTDINTPRTSFYPDGDLLLCARCHKDLHHD